MNMLEISLSIWKLMNQLKFPILLLTTNLSWWLMKQKPKQGILTIVMMYWLSAL